MSERNTPYLDGELLALPVAASTTIKGGHLVAVNASGYLVPAADTAGLTVVGVAMESQDNSAGANGALSCLLRRRKVFVFENHATNAVTQAMVGKNVYVADSVTVCSDGATNDIVAGICLGIGPDGVLVEISGDLTILIPEQVTPEPFPKAASQADCTATDVEGVVTDFNALLARLRTAGLMAT